MTFQEWQFRWKISEEAVKELVQMSMHLDKASTGKSEAEIQQNVRLQAAKHGAVLWRNNVGVASDPRGGIVRFGIANDSQQVNKRVKSSDLVGIRPVIITPEMVGTRVGIFVAREVKHGGWKFTGSDREKAQLAYLSIVNSLGGDAAFSTGEFK